MLVYFAFKLLFLYTFYVYLPYETSRCIYRSKTRLYEVSDRDEVFMVT